MKKGYVFSGLFLFLGWAFLQVTGVGGCGNSSTSAATQRRLSGTLSQTSLARLTLEGETKAATSVTSCSEVRIVCFDYTGSKTTADFSDDCSFSIDLALSKIYACCGYAKTDDPATAEPLGCLSEGSSFALPIYADGSGGTDEIALGTLTREADGSISTTNNLLASVDEDGDGTVNSGDSDDDGDSVADSSDDFNNTGNASAFETDGDGNGFLDIAGSKWDSYTDTDSDGIPNFADDDCDGDGTKNETDTDDDGDGIADTADTDDLGDGIEDDAADDDGDGICNELDGDIDNDGSPNSVDADDDGDGTADSSDTDDDGDGILDTSEVDADGDGIADTLEDGTASSCATQQCTAGDDFSCQRYADNNIGNSFGITTANAKCVDLCCSKQ